MSSDREPQSVTPDLLRQWPLPEGGESKKSRGTVLVVGGSTLAPGAAMLAGVAALRVGAGRITLAVAESVATAVAVAVPESGVLRLDETDGHVRGDSVASVAAEMEGADAVVVGPGLDDLDETAALLAEVGRLDLGGVLVLDAFALGALSGDPSLRDALPSDLLLTPNLDEATRLLGRDVDADDLATDIAEIADRYRATVTCHAVIASDGEVWRLGTGASGLGTSGSGDVLAGAVAGFCARGVDPARAAVWGTHVHAVAGDRLAVRVGPLGYLASELLVELPRVLVEIAA
jgi:ADP-dependent NAD(P)H-hydrate dehydratase